MTDIFFSLPIIIILTTVGILFIKRKSYSANYTSGVREGVRILYELFPALLLLCISVKLISSCGIIEDLSYILSKTSLSEYIDSELIPLILTRPLSGSASSALLSEIAENSGAASRSVFTAALMVSSSDTCIYIHSTYFSCVSQKKNSLLLGLMLGVTFFSCVICIIISHTVF